MEVSGSQLVNDPFNAIAARKIGNRPQNHSLADKKGMLRHLLKGCAQKTMEDPEDHQKVNKEKGEIQFR